MSYINETYIPWISTHISTHIYQFYTSLYIWEIKEITFFCYRQYHCRWHLNFGSQFQYTHNMSKSSNFLCCFGCAASKNDIDWSQSGLVFEIFIFYRMPFTTAPTISENTFPDSWDGWKGKILAHMNRYRYTNSCYTSFIPISYLIEKIGTISVLQPT